MSNLFLPYTVKVASVEEIAAPEYSVDIVASTTKIETRTLLASDPAEGSIKITIDNELDETLGALWDFYQLCSGPHRSFSIREDHNVYDLIPYFARSRFLPYWRFSEKLVFGLENGNLCLFGTSISVKNVAV